MKSAQTVAVFPDPPASMPAGLFADFEITERKRPSAFVASYGIQVIVVALLLTITLTTTAPVLIQKKYSAISLVAPTFSDSSPVRQPVARISARQVAVASPKLPEVAAPMRIPAPRTPRVERTMDVTAPPAPKPLLQPKLLAESSCDARRKARPYRFLWRSQRRTRATADQRDKSRSGTCSGRELWNPGYEYGPPDGTGRGYRSIWHSERRFWPDKQSCEEC